MIVASPRVPGDPGIHAVGKENVLQVQVQAPRVGTAGQKLVNVPAPVRGAATVVARERESVGPVPVRIRPAEAAVANPDPAASAVAGGRGPVARVKANAPREVAKLATKPAATAANGAGPGPVADPVHGAAGPFGVHAVGKAHVQPVAAKMKHVGIVAHVRAAAAVCATGAPGARAEVKVHAHLEPRTPKDNIAQT